MISGVATAIKGRFPGVKVFAAEPSAADDAARSKAAGSIQQHMYAACALHLVAQAVCFAFMLFS